MIAAGIDPSLTSTGVGVLVDGKLKHAQRYGRPGHNGASYHSRSNRIRQLRTEVFKAATIAGTPDLIVMEEQPYSMGTRTVHDFDRNGLWHMIYEAFDARQIPVVVVGNSIGKVWVTGFGGASKLDMIEVIDEWYAGQLDRPLAAWRKNENADDVADALGYATIGAYKLGDPIPFEPKDRHRTGLLLVPWPKIARAR